MSQEMMAEGGGRVPERRTDRAMENGEQKMETEGEQRQKQRQKLRGGGGLCRVRNRFYRKTKGTGRTELRGVWTEDGGE